MNHLQLKKAITCKTLPEINFCLMAPKSFPLKYNTASSIELIAYAIPTRRSPLKIEHAVTRWVNVPIVSSFMNICSLQKVIFSCSLAFAMQSHLFLTDKGMTKYAVVSWFETRRNNGGNVNSFYTPPPWLGLI